MADKAEKRKYNYMENVLNYINKKYISLNEDEVKRNNKILESVLTTFINKMKEKDPLFKYLFQSVFYGGSYYDGLRVGQPEEFDLDLLLRLPKYAEPTITTSNQPGFVHLELKNYEGWSKQPEALPHHAKLRAMFDDKLFLNTQKVLAWMEGIVKKAMNDFPTQGTKSILKNENGVFEVSVHKGGPAHTLKISGSGVKMDVDLVACFVFPGDKWPKEGFTPNPVKTKPNFFIVPKEPKGMQNGIPTRYWRLSFQEQERVLMDSKKYLKPCIKLLKKLRDSQQHSCVASYFIKTAVLHIADSKDAAFWDSPLSYCFMTVLKEYASFIEKGKIPYYWNKKNNLLAKVSPTHLANMSNRLKYIISDIERNQNTPETVAKYLVPSLSVDEVTSGMGKLSLK